MAQHGILGRGLLEAVYQDDLEIELELRGTPFVPKPKVTINTKGRQLHPHYKLDLVVFEGVVVEITALERPQVFPAQGRPSDQLR